MPYLTCKCTPVLYSFLWLCCVFQNTENFRLYQEKIRCTSHNAIHPLQSSTLVVSYSAFSYKNTSMNRSYPNVAIEVFLATNDSWDNPCRKAYFKNCIVRSTLYLLLALPANPSSDLHYARLAHLTGHRVVHVKHWKLSVSSTHKLPKIQQVNLRDSPCKVAVTCRELQYHSNLHRNNSKT